jgi:P27 family predicted phage terminase small subunit
LEGLRGGKTINVDGTFRPQTGLPTMPANMSVDAKKAWKRLVPELLTYNLISVVNADALEELCETIGLLKVLRRSINSRQALLVAEGKDPAEAIEVRTPNSMRIQSPIYQAMNREREKLRTWLGEFGLTPAQAARVTTAVRAQPDLFDANKPTAKSIETAQSFADF